MSVSPSGETVADHSAGDDMDRARGPSPRISGERVLLAHDRPLPVDLRAILDGIAAQLILALGTGRVGACGP